MIESINFCVSPFPNSTASGDGPEQSVNTHDSPFLCVWRPNPSNGKRGGNQWLKTNLYSIFEMVAVHRSLVSCAMYTRTCDTTYMSSQRVVVDEYGRAASGTT